PFATLLSGSTFTKFLSLYIVDRFPATIETEALLKPILRCPSLVKLWLSHTFRNFKRQRQGLRNNFSSPLFDHVNRIDDDLFNHILWFDAMDYKPYPKK